MDNLCTYIKGQVYGEEESVFSIHIKHPLPLVELGELVEDASHPVLAQVVQGGPDEKL